MKSRYLALVLSIVGSTQSHGSIILTFDEMGDGVEVGDFYDGGPNSNGIEGPAYGISFKPGAIVRGQEISNLPGPAQYNALSFFEYQQSLNAYNGFTSFSFSYSSPYETDASVSVWSGLFGSGRSLGSTNLVQTGDSCGSTRFSCWSSASVDFQGTGQSVVFRNAGDVKISFANMEFNSNLSGEMPVPAPEPNTWLMLVVGFGVIGYVLRVRNFKSFTS